VLHLGLELEALSAVCDRVVYLDAVLHKLDADKGLFFLSLLFVLLLIVAINAKLFVSNLWYFTS